MKRYLMPFTALLLAAAFTLHYLNLDVLLWQSWKLNRQPMPEQAINLGQYRADIEALPLAGLDDDLSALTYNSETNTLFGLLNGNPLLVEISLEGQVLRTVRIEGGEDMEGLAHVGGNRYVIAEERNHRLVVIELPESVTQLDTSEAASLTIALDAGDNKGLEGLSWDPHGQRLLVVKERDPLRVLVVEGFVDGVTVPPDIRIHEKISIDPAALFLADLSSVTTDEQSGHLLLLSDESHMVVEYGRDGEPLSVLGLWRGMSGLSKTVPQAEGLAIDNQRRVYVVSEPNLFYRFVPTE